jgi:hypothetical protein
VGYDRDRAAEFAALMYLAVHDRRELKGYSRDVLDVLYERGLISDPKSKAKSVVLTEDGLAKAAKAFETLLPTQPAGARRAKKVVARATRNRLPELQSALDWSQLISGVIPS